MRLLFEGGFPVRSESMGQTPIVNCGALAENGSSESGTKLGCVWPRVRAASFDTPVKPLLPSKFDCRPRLFASPSSSLA